MIYNVEMALGADRTEAEWAPWYSEMKPIESFLSVPGFRSAQRFQGLVTRPVYFALFSVESAAVLESLAYRGGGGGKIGSDRWRPLITLWHRDLFDGAEMAPDVPMDALLAVFDSTAPRALPSEINTAWVTAVNEKPSTPHRAFGIVPSELAVRWSSNPPPGVRLYRPLIPRLLAPA